MKKTMIFTLALIACVFSFVSCDKKSESETTAPIVGTWKFTSIEGTVSAMGRSQPISKEDFDLGETITFNADGTTSDKGTTYKVENGKLTLRSTDGEAIDFVIETLNASTLKLGLNQTIVEEDEEYLLPIEITIDATIIFSRVK